MRSAKRSLIPPSPGCRRAGGAPTSLPACGGALQSMKINQRSSKLDADLFSCFAEREALEPTYSRNIIKLQIINNQTLFGVHSKSKSF